MFKTPPRCGYNKGGTAMAPISEAQKKATAKYHKKAYDRLEIKVAKGRKQAIQDVAQAQGESLNSFVNTAIDERIGRLQGTQDGRDNKKRPSGLDSE